MKRVLNAVGYNRVSTPGQVDNTSLSYQSKVIKNRANADGVNLIKIFSEEGKSGTNTNRPQYQALMDYIDKNDVDILYVYDTSRLHRNLEGMTLDLKWFRVHNKKIIFVSQDWDSSCEDDYDMIITQAIVDAKYSRSIKNNSLRGLSSRAADCMHTGGKPPYGFKVNRDTMLLELDETTAPAVKKMFELYADGFGTADIIKWLKDNGYKTSKGNDFKVNTINEILHNEKYKGCYTWNKATSKDEDGKRNTHKHKESYFKKEGGCPALVTPEVFEKVQQKLNENAEKHSNRAPDRYYPLTGMIYCSCGSPMCGGVRYSKDRKYYKYNCNNKCGTAPIRADYLEAFVINAVSTCLFSEPNRQPLLDALNHISRNIKDTSNKEYRALRRALSGLDDRHRNLMAALEKGKVTDSIMNSLEKIERQKGEITTKIKLLSRGSHQFNEADLQKLQEGFDHYMITENTINNKYLLRKIIERVDVDEEQVRITLKCGISIDKSTKITMKGNDDMIRRPYIAPEVRYENVEGIILGFYESENEGTIKVKLAVMVTSHWSYDVVDIELPTEYLYKMANESEINIFELVGAKVAAQVKLKDDQLCGIMELDAR